MATNAADLLLKIDASTAGLRKELKKAEGAVNGGRQAIDRNTKQIDKSFTSMGDNVKRVVGGIVAAMGLIKIGKKFADIVVETEKLKGSLTTITGSVENAGKAFDKLTEFASQTPFTLDQSVNAFIKLKALGLDPSERAMLSYGNTASAMGKDMMQMIEAVADASTGEFERLKEFGIKAKSEGDNVALTFQGVTTTIGKNSEEIQGYLLAIGETQFAGAMEDQMERLPGLLSNLQDNVDGLFRKMGDKGGISIFGAGITAASGAVMFLTENIETVLSVISYVGAALAGPAIIGAIALTTKAIIAMNAALLANPIALVAAGFAVAALAIYKNWEQITEAAEKSAIYIQIAWNKLKLFLMDAFAPVLTTISELFTDVKNRAIATWTAIAAAARDPLNAIDTFNETFETSLRRLRDGETGSNVFARSIHETKGRIVQLEGELGTMNTRVVEVDDAIVDTTFSLSDFKTETQDTTAAADEMNAKALEVLGTLSNEREALTLSSVELDIRNRLQKAGVAAGSELGVQIRETTTLLHKEKDAMTQAATEAKELEKANDESARAAQEAWGRTHDYLSTTFVDIMNNGKDAFSQIASAFTALIKRMVAEWAASGLMGMLSGKGLSGFNAGTGIGNLFSEGGVAANIGKVLGIGGGAVAAGTAVGGTAGVSTVFAAGASSAAGITSSAIGAGGAAAAGTGGAAAAGTSAGFGSSLAAFATNPVTIGVVAAAALAKVLEKDPTYSANAGLLIHDAPGASADRKFAVDPFDSGFAPIGFARREDQGTANQVIDVFRGYDSALTQLAKVANLNVNYGNNPFGGFDENGQGNGLFLGVAKEDGKDRGASVEQQTTQFVSQWIDALGGQITPDERNMIKSAGSADDMIAMAANLVGVDGSHEAGLRRVPFDGYIAQLHKNEEVLTANDPRNANSGGAESMSMLSEMRKISASVKRTADLLTRVTRDGNSLMTEPA